MEGCIALRACELLIEDAATSLIEGLIALFVFFTFLYLRQWGMIVLRSATTHSHTDCSLRGALTPELLAVLKVFNLRLKAFFLVECALDSVILGYNVDGSPKEVRSATPDERL